MRAEVPGRYAVPAHWVAGVHLAIVTDPVDPDGRGRVQVVIPAIDPERQAPIWARVATPFAGDNFGAFLIPDKDTEVLLAFAAGDTSAPVVLGNFWNGKAAVPEHLPGRTVDRWTLTGKAGTRIAIVEEASGQEKVEITTPGNASVLVSEEAGGRILLETSACSIEITSSDVTVRAAGNVNVSAAQLKVSAGLVKVDAGMADFSGTVKCATLVTNSVVSSMYTPGAGNVW